jgi:hypothetical protein
MPDSDTSSGGINEPLLPPLQDITATNKGPIILATAVTLFIISALTVIVKLWTRFATTRNLGANDAAILAALVCALCQRVR